MTGSEIYSFGDGGEQNTIVTNNKFRCEVGVQYRCGYFTLK